MELTIAFYFPRKERLEREQQFMEDKKRKKEDKRKRETSQKVKMLFYTFLPFRYAAGSLCYKLMQSTFFFFFYIV